MDRSKFVYKIFDSVGRVYGVTTDVYILPVGTKFRVVNGMWDGEIVEKDGKKYILVIDTDKLIELKDDYDYTLVLRFKGGYIK